MCSFPFCKPEKKKNLFLSKLGNHSFKLWTLFSFICVDRETSSIEVRETLLNSVYI